jgi:two-component system NarL family response regulator
MPSVSVLLVDDHPVVRKGLRTLLSTDETIKVVGEAPNAEEAVRMALDLRPQVLLMDIRMPGKDGLEATREIKRRLPSVNVIMLTGYEDDYNALQALDAGAAGYLSKDSSLELITSSIHSVAEGGVIVKKSRLPSPVMAEHREGPFHPSSKAVKGLSPREMQVLKMLTEGASNKEIARALGLAEITVKKHMQNIFTKLEVFDRTQAAVKAVRSGLISEESHRPLSPFREDTA